MSNFVIALISLFSWGVGSFVAKLATNRIGERSVFWDLVGYAPAVLIYCILFYNLKNILHGDKIGILLAILAGFIGSFGLIFFYVLLSRKDASSAVPMTAIYPALTAILAIIFLREKLTIVKSVGIVLSAVALYLLSL